MSRFRDHLNLLPIALIACAMLLRVLVPAGWMPTTGPDGMIRVALCTGTGAQPAWIDRAGTVHTEMPGGGDHDPQPCGFGSLGLGLDARLIAALPLPALAAEAVQPVARQALRIGGGLAAPPPPSTGPPSLI